MSQKKLNLIGYGLLFSAASLFAESTLKEAISAAKVSGEVAVYTETTNQKSSSVLDSGFTAGTIGVALETGSINNFSAKVGFKASHEFTEEKKDNYDSRFLDNSIMTEALIQYTQQAYSLTLGRQTIDLAWLGDFNEAIVAQIAAFNDITITAGYSHRQATVDEDEMGRFSELTQDGVYVLDVKHTLNKNITLNPYFYLVDKVTDIYGIQASFTHDMFGIMGHYAVTNEDAAGVQNGSVAHIELNANIGSIALIGGYITTGKDTGLASMSTYGENIDPTEELGAAVLGTNADTYYAKVSTNIYDIDLGLLYANSEYKSGGINKELDEISLSAGYAINSETGLSFTYSDVNGDTTADDFNKASLTVVYTF